MARHIAIRNRGGVGCHGPDIRSCRRRGGLYAHRHAACHQESRQTADGQGGGALRCFARCGDSSGPSRRPECGMHCHAEPGNLALRRARDKDAGSNEKARLAPRFRKNSSSLENAKIRPLRPRPWPDARSSSRRCGPTCRAGCAGNTAWRDAPCRGAQP